MKLVSTNFEHNSSIPSLYTCQGKDISPELNFSNVPKNAKSLALIVDDPDASNGDWVHWIIWNIPVSTTSIPENIGRDFAIQGTNSFGELGYGGPCPPNGTHRYFFKLYALNKTLDLPTTSNKQTLLKAMEGAVIEQTELLGTYKKN